MKNEQAIEMLINLKNSNGAFTGYTSGFYECMDKAIQALERIDKLQSAYQRVLSAKSYDDVKDLEPEDLLVGLMGVLGIQEPCKVGHWGHKEITDGYHVIGQCSICKERRRIGNFCANCGARMESEVRND